MGHWAVVVACLEGDSHEDEDDGCCSGDVVDSRGRHFLWSIHIMRSCRNGQGNTDEEQQAAASFVDHGAKVLLLELSTSAKEAHTCNHTDCEGFHDVGTYELSVVLG